MANASATEDFEMAGVENAGGATGGVAGQPSSALSTWATEDVEVPNEDWATHVSSPLSPCATEDVEMASWGHASGATGGATGASSSALSTHATADIQPWSEDHAGNAANKETDDSALDGVHDIVSGATSPLTTPPTSDTEEMNVNEYFIVQGILGSGGSAVVYQWQHVTIPYAVAAKVESSTCLRPNGKETPEAHILQLINRFQHPRIIHLHGCYPHQPTALKVTTLLELCATDLRAFGALFHSRGVRVPEAFLWHTLIHLIEALAFLHTGFLDHHGVPLRSHNHHILHRDLKPHNILLDWSTQDTPGLPNLKLADFGHASCLHCTHRHAPQYTGGTYVYQPPEAPVSTAAADIWALGATLQWLATGHEAVQRAPPGMNHDQRVDYYMDAPRRRYSVVQCGYSAQLEVALGWLMERDMTTRPSARWLLEQKMGGFLFMRRVAFTAALPAWAMT